MASVEKPRQILSVIARGRRLKGNKTGVFFTVPYKQALTLGISPGDMLEMEIRKVTHPMLKDLENSLKEQDEVKATPGSE